MHRVFKTLSDQVPSLVELAGFGKTVRQVQELASLLGKLEMLRSESSFKTTNELLLALTMLAEQHTERHVTDLQVELKNRVLQHPSMDEMERARRYCGYSFSSYDRDLMKRICTFDSSADADVNILQLHPKSSHGRPAHFIIERRTKEEKEILIAVRGTMELGDAISSTLCASETLFEGMCHGGILNAANYLFDEHRHLIRICSEAGYKIRLCGHSYGGGAASVLAMMLKSSLPDADIRTYGFATPAIMSACLVRDSEDFVTTYVNGYDCVPRASIANARKLLEDLNTFDWRARYEARVDQICAHTDALTSRIEVTKPIVETVRTRLLRLSEENEPMVSSSSVSLQDVAQDIDLSDVDLYPPGQCVQLHNDCQAYYVDATCDFNSLILTPTCVSDHRIAHYVYQFGESWGNFDTNALKHRRRKRTREALDNIIKNHSVWT